MKRGESHVTGQPATEVGRGRRPAKTVKVYKRKNLEIAWEKVKENRGSGGVDGQNLEAFEAQLGV